MQDALLTKDAELRVLKLQGSIPARKDAANDEAVTSNVNAEAFAKIVAAMKSRPRSVNMENDIVQMGKIWNSVAGGQLSPSVGAAQVVSGLNNVK